MADEKPSPADLTKRAEQAALTLKSRGRQVLGDPFQNAIQLRATQNLLVKAGLFGEADLDYEILTVQAEHLEAMVQATSPIIAATSIPTGAN